MPAQESWKKKAAVPAIDCKLKTQKTALPDQTYITQATSFSQNG
jgi:hypothetical protein